MIFSRLLMMPALPATGGCQWYNIWFRRCLYTHAAIHEAEAVQRHDIHQICPEIGPPPFQLNSHGNEPGLVGHPVDMNGVTHNIQVMGSGHLSQLPGHGNQVCAGQANSFRQRQPCFNRGPGHLPGSGIGVGHLFFIFQKSVFFINGLPGLGIRLI